MLAPSTNPPSDYQDILASLELGKRLRQKIGSAAGNVVRDLRVDFRAGSCVLIGKASSYYAKQVAQTAAMAMLPGVCLENRITVLNGCA